MVGVRRLAHIIVEAVDLDATFRVHQRCERVREPPRGVRVMRRSTGVGVTRHGANAEVAVEDALAAERQDRAPFAVERATFLERAVGLCEPGLEREKSCEIRAPGLLLTLDQEPDADRKLAEHGAVRLDRLDP